MPVALAMIVTAILNTFNHWEGIGRTVQQGSVYHWTAVHLSIEVENQPQQQKEVESTVKGTSRSFHWAMKPLDRREDKKNKKNLNVFDENVASCMFDTILYYWYDSCKVFFKQLNNLLSSMLPQRVPDLDRKLNSPPAPLFSFLWDSQWVRGLLPLSPHMKRL